MRQTLFMMFFSMMLTAAGPAMADDPVFSGPQPGEKLPAFESQAVFGPNAGQPVDFVSQAGGKPLVLVFVHQLTRPSAGLTRALMSYARTLEDKGLHRGIVWLAADPSEAEQYLNRARGSLNLDAPVGLYAGGLEGPGALGLNRNVTLTILTAKEGKVTANFALVQPSDTELPAIAAEVAKVAGVEPPTAEQVRNIAYPANYGGRGGPAMRGQMQRGQAADARLTAMLRQMSDEKLSAEQVQGLILQVNQYAGGNGERQAELSRLSGYLLELGFGGEAARRAFTRWSGAAAGERGEAEGNPNAQNDPQLVEMMRPLIQPGLTAERAEQLAASVKQYIGDDADKRAQFMRISGIVLERGYGNEIGQAQFKTLREHYEK